ncbi:MAG: hypothetical protein AMJ78_07970 [Omnitrophica WOR_2 bacterium SM23_29]|nr:MAG: hypothetical protein AMJ78_07970 [Omnitrophica WOR_2 bacterium SM23_29]
MENRLRKYFYSLMSDRAEGIIANIIKLFLLLLSLVYYCVIKISLFLYKFRILKSYRPQCKVISVGNITLGGTGKTPLVLAVARRLKGSGKRLAILIRGYKGEATLGTSDEVELLRRHLPDVPILVGRDRIKTAKEAVDSCGADIILLDDGFQHWRLSRDIDILTLDINNPLGNGKLIPRGILREPVSSLKRADVFMLTKVGYDGDSIAKAQGLKNRLNTINRDAIVFTSSYVPTMLYDIFEGKPISLSEINGKDTALICGIADPESFEEGVKSQGAKVVLKYYFLDHHKYNEREIEGIINECKRKGVDAILTTEKDVPRLVDVIRNLGIKFLALSIELKIDNEEKFFGRLYSIFSR